MLLVRLRRQTYTTLGVISSSVTRVIISQDGAGGVPGMTIADNAYVDADTGSYAYQTTDQAANSQEAGVLTFSNAASGTAGAALSLTERLRVDPTATNYSTGRYNNSFLR